MESCWCIFPVMDALEARGLETKVSIHLHLHLIIIESDASGSICCTPQKSLVQKGVFFFIVSGPYELGGVFMSHKKTGNEEGARRARANLKDINWCVTFVFYETDFIKPKKTRGFPNLE